MPGAGIVILAAGASTRLGKPKQLLPFRGRSLLRHAAETALASSCRPVVVVLGASVERMKSELSGLPVMIAVNPGWESGMSSSIRAGLEALTNGKNADAGVGAVVIMVCDQPLVTAKLLDQIVELHDTSGEGIITSEYNGTMGVPSLFSQEYYPELTTLAGCNGAKQIIMKHVANVQSIAFPGGAIDVDTEQDYKELEVTGGKKTQVWQYVIRK